MELKVYNIGLTIDGRQCQVIVCTKTKKAAFERLIALGHRHLTYRYFTTYGGWTGNELSLKTATQEGDVFYKALHDWDGPYKRLTEVKF